MDVLSPPQLMERLGFILISHPHTSSLAEMLLRSVALSRRHFSGGASSRSCFFLCSISAAGCLALAIVF